MYAHLRKLAEIADANNGSRAEGTPGYDASVDYVAQTLRDKGFDVQTPEFERLGAVSAGQADARRSSGRDYPVDQASLLTPTPAGGLRRRHVAAAEACGLRGRRLRRRRGSTGAIAVVDDTGCSIVDKQDTAVAEGAVGLARRQRPRRRRAARRDCSRPGTTSS